MAWLWIAITIFLIFMTCGGGAGVVHKMLADRRTARLDLKREEARIAEARAKERELEHQQAELEYRQALLELERFDRRTGRMDRPVPSELDPAGLAHGPDPRRVTRPEAMPDLR